MSKIVFIALFAQAALIQYAFSQCLNSYLTAPALSYAAGPVYSSADLVNAGLVNGVYNGGFLNPGYNGGLASVGYGGYGTGQLACAGELPVFGVSELSGNVPSYGAVQFGGNLAAGGYVTIAGSTPCQC